MADLFGLMGLVRNGAARTQTQVDANEKNEILVAQGLPPYAEMVRKGVSWATMSTSAVAGLVVRPTTTAAFEIFNGYSSGGKSLIIDRMFFFNLVSTNVIEGFSGWAAVTAAKAAVTTGSFAVRGSNGKAYGGPVIAAASTTVIDSGWFPWTNAYQKGAGVVPFGATLPKSTVGSPSAPVLALSACREFADGPDVHAGRLVVRRKLTNE
jgi:hypothetical protein